MLVKWSIPVTAAASLTGSNPSITPEDQGLALNCEPKAVGPPRGGLEGTRQTSNTRHMRSSRCLRTLLAAGVLLLGGEAIPHMHPPERAVAVTFDDLPVTPSGVVANDVASLKELTSKMLSAVRAHSIPAVDRRCCRRAPHRYRGARR